MKKLFLSLAILIAMSSLPKAVLAQENCVTVYGGGVVCGAETHEPVETDLGDINPAILGIGFLLASGSLLYFSRKIAKNTQVNK
jgi:hypothetical protein